MTCLLIIKCPSLFSFLFHDEVDFNVPTKSSILYYVMLCQYGGIVIYVIMKYNEKQLLYIHVCIYIRICVYII